MRDGKVKIDVKTLKILKLLMKNSKLSYRQIAKKLGISPTAVISRIRSLENAGIIKKYTIELDYSKLGFDFPVIIEVRVSKGMLAEVEKRIAEHPNVLGVYDITGDFDVAILALFKTRKDLDRFVKNLQRLEYVERTYTKLILNIIKNERNIEIDKVLREEVSSEEEEFELI